MSDAQRPRRVAWELGALLLTGALHLVFEEVLQQKGLFIGLAAVGWTAYVAWRLRHEPGLAGAWRLGWLGDLRANRLALLALVLGAAALAAMAGVRGTLRFHPHLAFMLLLYPLWGWVQQFLLQALLAENLRAWLGEKRSYFVAVALFTAIHAPDWTLMAATALLAALFVPLYRKGAALVPLGIAHGMLGALMYFWILERDSWAELFG